MKYDEYDHFDSPDLRSFGNIDKKAVLFDLHESGMKLISPREQIYLCLNLENKKDLEELRSMCWWGSRTILLNKQNCINEKDGSIPKNSYENSPDLIIVSSEQLNKVDLLYQHFGDELEHDFGKYGLYSSKEFSLEEFNELQKNALRVPDALIKDFMNYYETGKGVKDQKWNAKFLEFILEGDQKLMKDYIKYKEETTKMPFFDTFKVYSEKRFHDWNFLKICADYNSFQFDDPPGVREHFGVHIVGITDNLSAKISK